MFAVKITYKSGKVEMADIEFNQYTKALEQLTEEGRLVGMEIIKVK